jgi:PAS domain S-box-containing protein
MPAQPQAAASWHFWIIGLGLILLLFAVVYVLTFFLRRMFQQGRESQSAGLQPSPRIENPSAFMAASMQGVIQKLKEQEKELERLHRAEKERAEHTERLSEEVTRNMPAGLLVVNAAGIISSANPAAEQALGIRGLAFRRYSEALGEGSVLTRILGQCLEDGRIYRREEIEHSTPGGDTRSLGVTISPIRRAGDKISGAICLLSDLTELAALQQQMRLKENLAALGELSAGIAHEFKNALATISGYAQMIRSEAGEGDTADNAERILEQTRNITHVVAEFLKYARPLEIPDEQVTLDRVVERVVTEVREAVPGVQVVAEGKFGSVAGDESLLRQAILNLARNAAEAAVSAPGGGRVVVQGSAETFGQTELQQIRVQDNGPGIPQEVLPKIFRPFYTTKANGSGLGLAVVQKIIVQHGGTVEARNRSEGGAEFIVTLPACSAVPEAIQSSLDRI